MTKTINDQQHIATRENTVFLTVAAFENYEEKTAAFCKSAEDCSVPLVLYDIGEPWQGFYLHKIERISKHLKRHDEEGKRFAFILDSRDVVFIDPIDTILMKFNALYDGRVIFNHDVHGKVWPSHNDYLARAISSIRTLVHVPMSLGYWKTMCFYVPASNNK